MRAERDGIGAGVMGIANAMFYVGFVVGIPLLNRVLQHVSRRRLYAASTGLMGLASLGYGLIVQPVAWLVLRGLNGMCLAGCYLVIETWLNGLAHNDVRGKVMGLYVAFSAAGLASGQLVLAFTNPSHWVAFAVAGVITGLAWVPLLKITNGAGTRHSREGGMTIAAVARAVPSGVVGFVLVGVTQGCLLGMSAVYAARAGLDARHVGLFVGAVTAGSIMLQLPVGAVADRWSRRGVMVVLCLVATGLCVALLGTEPGSAPSYLLAFALGGFSSPLYAVGGSYTYDWLPRHQIVSASTALLMTYSIGAVFGPLFAGAVMTSIGAEGYFWALIAGHALLALFMGYRMVVAPDRAAVPLGLD